MKQALEFLNIFENGRIWVMIGNGKNEFYLPVTSLLINHIIFILLLLIKISYFATYQCFAMFCKEFPWRPHNIFFSGKRWKG